MSFSLDIFVINNGYKVILQNLEEVYLDDLRGCIYDFVSQKTKLNLDCNDEFPNGLLSNLTYIEYKLFANKAIHIYPENKKVWKNTVLYFKKPVSTEIKKLQEILDQIPDTNNEDKVTYEDPLFNSAANQHQHEVLKKGLKKSIDYFNKPIKYVTLKPYK